MHCVHVLCEESLEIRMIRIQEKKLQTHRFLIRKHMSCFMSMLFVFFMSEATRDRHTLNIPRVCLFLMWLAMQLLLKDYIVSGILTTESIPVYLTNPE